MIELIAYTLLYILIVFFIGFIGGFHVGKQEGIRHQLSESFETNPRLTKRTSTRSKYNRI